VLLAIYLALLKLCITVLASCNRCIPGDGVYVASQQQHHAASQVWLCDCRYGLSCPAVADILEEAVNHVLDSGYRTGDIMAEGCTQVTCSKMGELLLEFVESKAGKSAVAA
jgi:hypothetical protein